jgi:uncharacterized membrane protein YdjX (TVP38/TMEM64 family)
METPQPELENELQQKANQNWLKENRRLLGLALAVASFMLVAHFTPLRSWISNVQIWKSYIRQFGLIAHIGFTMAIALAVMIGVPRLPLCAVSGLIFGFGEGVILSWLGSSLGSYGSFLLARAGGQTKAQAILNSRPWLQSLTAQPTWLRVAWLRQLMLPGMVINVLLGMTRVRHRIFWLGTLVGYLPLNIAFSLVGSGLGKENLTHTLVQILAALAVINLMGLAIAKKRATAQNG